MREGRLRTQALALLLCDTIMVMLAMQIAWWLRFDLNNWIDTHYHIHPFGIPGWTPGQPYVLALFVTLPLFWLILREMNLYSQPEDGAGEFFRLSAAVMVAAVLLACVSFYFKVYYADRQFQFSRAYSVYFVLSAIFTLSAGRAVFRHFLRGLSQKGIGSNRILIVGTGPLAEELAKFLSERGTNTIVGTLEIGESAAAEKSEPIFPMNVLGKSENLVEIANRCHCDEVVVASPDSPPDLMRRLAEDCYRAHVRFRMVPDIYEMLLDHMDLSLAGDIPLLGMRGSRIEGVNFLCKRLFDIAVSFLLLAVLVPLVFSWVALWIKLQDGGPVFYYQERIGYRRRRFKFWKFRSMRLGADKGGSVETHKDYLKKYIAGTADGAKDSKGRVVFKITEDPRVTKFGRFIRQYSIDELPQLWNVLKGDMSLIGPRPPIAYEVENYRPIHLRRFEVLPGISGLWQVSGRNRLTFDEMIKLDLYYIENWSLELDVRILFKTVSVVLLQRAH